MNRQKSGIPGQARDDGREAKRELSRSGGNPPGDPLVKANTLGRNTNGGKAMEFGIDAQRDLPAIGSVRCFTACRAEGQIVIDALTKSRLDFGKVAAFKGHDIAQADNATDEDPVIGFDGAIIAPVFKRRIAPPLSLTDRLFVNTSILRGNRIRSGKT